MPCKQTVIIKNCIGNPTFFQKLTFYFTQQNEMECFDNGVRAMLNHLND